jgi:hypothetical protein
VSWCLVFGVEIDESALFPTLVCVAVDGLGAWLM